MSPVLQEQADIAGNWDLVVEKDTDFARGLFTKRRPASQSS
jgi:hypothetical protein